MMTIEHILAAVGVKSTAKTPQLTRATVTAEQLAPLATRLVSEFHLPLSLLYATQESPASDFGMHAVFSHVASHGWLVVSTTVPFSKPEYPSLTPTVMAAHWYERYMQDMFGLKAVGHPDPRRLVHHENVPEGTYPLRKGFAWNTKLDHADVPYPMHHVEGEGIYEIPVGPIHAGIIEPGHFRFNVAGERIITLEGKLFFTHKGVEKLLEGKTPMEALPFIERLSGDMAAANALAFCEAVEAAAGCEVPKPAQLLRTLLVELERLTMHIHDLANMGGMGTGFSYVAASGFRIKERLMRLSMDLFGNRYWRGQILPGGAKRILSEEEKKQILTVVKEATEEMQSVLSLAMSSDAFLERLETTGVLSKAAAIAYGALGVPARASGVDIDVRRDHPYAAFRSMPDLVPQIITQTAGDVHARFTMRIEEIKTSMDIVRRLLTEKGSGGVLVPCLAQNGSGLGAVESWRGEVLVAVRLKDGKIDRCFPRDPSFCNWALFGEIGPGNIVPDFPLCNKSLNLSYSGTDM
ncbi:NADH-quinone oxidoreductase subunit C [Candidatus Uhrbacteria bacterium]|nr:NADH-quinone oxidoreductase subunit C [Candidatus Uhrbacteria bacterium]